MTVWVLPTSMASNITAGEATRWTGATPKHTRQDVGVVERLTQAMSS